MLFVLKSIHYTITLKQDISLRRSSLQYARHFLFYLPPFSFTFPAIFSLTFTAILFYISRYCLLYFPPFSFTFTAILFLFSIQARLEGNLHEKYSMKHLPPPPFHPPPSRYKGYNRTRSGGEWVRLQLVLLIQERWGLKMKILLKKKFAFQFAILFLQFCCKKRLKLVLPPFNNIF